MLSDGTIIALSTPPGSGAISLIRISGKLAFEKTKLFIRLKSKKKWSDLQPNYSVLADFLVKETLLDEVLITKFSSPNSYTGEDVVEIACHGSPYIQQQIISTFLAQGILPAQGGEFTLRAYLNRKMDLSQAEAVADLIASESQSAHQLAVKQMRGGFSKNLDELREQLIQFKALIELELDFSEEDVTFANKEHLNTLLNTLYKDLSKLKNSFAYGNVIKNGVPVTIAGKPNSGKSSLLNALLKEEKAIVSNIPGTTRDTIEDTLIIEGILFRFIDTAGLRNTQDVVEAIGVKKAREKVQQATLLIYLYERNQDLEDLATEINSLHHEHLELFLIENKIDLYPKGFDQSYNQNLIEKLNPNFPTIAMGISTFEMKGLTQLKRELVQTIQRMGNQNAVVVNNIRHFHALGEALNSIENVTQGLKNDLPGDLLSIDLKEAIEHVGAITGKIDPDQDVLGTIFGQFCIGK